ncbi:MAG: hypothetical protein PHX04_04135 [Bacilli bacterium]|nr:hypothetical protein [Bacilli bacterium]
MKSKYSRFRELWAVPKYRTLFKLGGYFLFFLIFFSLASIGNNSNNSNYQEEENITYNMMKKDLISSNISIKYEITSERDYFLEGTIINNVLNSTLEDEIDLKKIKIIEDKIYLIQKDIEIEEKSLLNDINLIYLFPSNVMDILDNNSSVMKQKDNNKEYNYNIDGINYLVYVNEEAIEQIIISTGDVLYSLKYMIIK